MAVYERGGNQDDTIHYWQERFSDRCKVVTSGVAWVDFIPFHTNKAKGIRKFQEVLKISPEECVVFGDENNDIEMLKCVPYSFAMAHSRDILRYGGLQRGPGLPDPRACWSGPCGQAGSA